MRIIHHHVGGRDGSTPFRFPALFEPDIDRVLYDADAPDSCFVGREGQRVRFHINYCPYTSSAKGISPAFADYYLPLAGMDYVIGEVARPVKTVELTARSLDALGARPDLLSLDTQGSEGDILAGATAALDHTLAVVSEVQFNRVYLDAPLFGDISAALQARGFLFVEFQDENRYAPMRGRMGTRGRGMTLFADAVFFRDPTQVPDPLARRKLAFVALCRGQLEFAQSCLADDLPLPDVAPPWLRFVEEFRALCAEPLGFTPWSFTDGWSADRSAARFGPHHDDPRWEAETLTGIDAEKMRTAATWYRSQAERTADLFTRNGLPEIAKVVLETYAAQMKGYMRSLRVYRA